MIFRVQIKSYIDTCIHTCIHTVRVLFSYFSSPVRLNISNLFWTSCQLANQCQWTNGFYGYEALGPGLWRDPTRHDELKWHIFDRASTACTLKEKRTLFPRMPRHAKSKLQLIFPAKWLSEMESASSKTGEGVKKFGLLRTYFDSFVAGSNETIVRQLSTMSVHWLAVTSWLQSVFRSPQAGLVRLRIPFTCRSTNERLDVSQRATVS